MEYFSGSKASIQSFPLPVFHSSCSSLLPIPNPPQIHSLNFNMVWIPFRFHRFGWFYGTVSCNFLGRRSPCSVRQCAVSEAAVAGADSVVAGSATRACPRRSSRCRWSCTPARGCDDKAHQRGGPLLLGGVF